MVFCSVFFFHLSSSPTLPSSLSPSAPSLCTSITQSYNYVRDCSSYLGCIVQKSSNQWLSNALPETHDVLTYYFGRHLPIMVIAHPDHETGNGSRAKHVEEQNHWSGPVDLSFRLQEYM